MKQDSYMSRTNKKKPNPIKKFMEIFNKPKTFKDRKKESKKSPSNKINLEEYEDYE